MDVEAIESVLGPVLERSRELGFLGPGAVGAHVANAMAFVAEVPSSRDGAAGPLRILDLGSGGGLPGLAIAVALPCADVVLLDASERRTTFLERAVTELGVGDRTRVVRGRAELLARTDLRGRFGCVTARSFGRPAVTVECAVGFLEGPDASLLVSEPPDADPSRWPADGLAAFGMVRGDVVVHDGTTIRRLELRSTVSDRWPRRDGIPSRRPMF